MRTLLLLLLIPAAVAVAAPLARLAFLSRRKKSSARPLTLLGRTASVERELSPEGFVSVDGELWRARTRSGGRVARGRDSVRVVGARGVELEVEPLGLCGDDAD